MMKIVSNHIAFPKNYNCNDLCPNTSFLAVNNLELNQKYTKWHKKLVETNGDHVPEWFWLLTDQGILGHVIREGDYKIVHKKVLKKGYIEKFYPPLHEMGDLEELLSKLKS